MANPNGEAESTLVGLLLIVGSGWFLTAGLIPWHAGLATVFVGACLMLPKRMRAIINSVKQFIRSGDKS